MESTDWQLRVIRPPTTPADSPIFEPVHQLWLDVWDDANAEIGRKQSLASDGLSRQHEIISLFHRGKPVALVCHRFVDFAAPSTYRDSYFLPEIWFDEDKERIRELGGFGIIGNQITIHPDFRKSTSGFATKELITALSMHRTRELDVDLLVAMVRSDKGLDRVFYDAGAEPLVKQRRYKNIVVDLITIRPKSRSIRIPSNLSALVEALWRDARFSGDPSLSWRGKAA